MHDASDNAAAKRRGQARDRAVHTLGDPRGLLVETRHQAADGAFFYAVRTTGVYCRPSCGARTPRPENVEFHATRESAERAGFRACRRCRPDRIGSDERSAASGAAQSAMAT